MLRTGFVSYSSSRSKSTSVASPKLFEAGLSFQHMILARMAKSFGSIGDKSSRVYTAKKGRIFTSSVTPNVAAVDELSKKRE
jgi:hypothetical protein